MSATAVNGVCRNAEPASRTPWCRIAMRIRSQAARGIGYARVALGLAVSSSSSADALAKQVGQIPCENCASVWSVR